QNYFCSNTFLPEVFYSNRFNSIRIHFWYFCLRCFIRIDLILFEYILFFSNINLFCSNRGAIKSFFFLAVVVF
ncbi:hypothetical protein GIB67_034277, partial [Kingdonia uniflora]